MADTTADTQGPADLDTAAPGAGADDENAALVAELEVAQGKKPAAKPGKKPAAKPEPEPAEDDDAETADDEAPEAEEAAADDDDEADDLDEDEDPDEDEDDADPDADEDAEVDADADPALKKRLDAVRRTEERQRRQLEQERATLERERTEFKAETKQLREAVEQIRGRAARAKIDPIGLLEAHGLTQDDMEYVAQLAFARSKSAATKGPEYRAAAERALRDREAAAERDALRAEVEEMKKGLESREAQAAADRELDAYFARAFRKASADATPITAKLIARRPKAAREELAVTATQLAAKLGRLPKVAELLAAHEKREVRALKLRGIKPPTPGAAKPATAAEVDADPAKPAAAAKPGKGAKAKPAKSAVADESDDDVAIPSTADLVRELQRTAN